MPLRDGPTEEFPVLHTMDGRRIVGKRPTWEDYRRVLLPPDQQAKGGEAVTWLDTTRLVEEVPGVPENERFYIWHERRIAWQGPTAQEGRDWASAQSITIDKFEPFEP